MDLTFEFDSAKSKRNKLKHGIDFVEAQELWKDEWIITLAARSELETRLAVVARIGNRHWLAVTTLRDGVTRIISVRRARSEEVQAYEAQADHR